MTGTLKARVGSSWVSIAGAGQEAANVARWNAAWGRVGQSAVKATTLPQSAPQLACTDPLTVTLTSGRRYRIRVVFRAIACGNKNGSAAFGLFDGGFNTGLYDGWISVANNYGGGTIENFYDGDGITHVYDVRGNGQSTDGLSPMVISAGAGANLYVEDVGPVTPVSIAPPTAGPRVVASGNALGIVQMGSFLTPLAPHNVPASVETAVTAPLPCTLSVGRRYRLGFQVRAISPTTPNNTVSIYLRDNGTVNRGTAYGGDPYVWMDGAYQGASYAWLFNGDGLSHSFEVLCNSISALDVYTDYGLYYLEDVGPNMSPALPIPDTPPAWTPLAMNTGWSNVGGTSCPLQYRKIGDIVTLRGEIAFSGSAANPMATMPATFRPGWLQSFPCVNRATPYGSLLAQISESGGGISIFGLSGATQFSLGTIQFSTTV